MSLLVNEEQCVREDKNWKLFMRHFWSWFFNVFILRILWHWILLLNSEIYGSSLFFVDLKFPIITVNLRVKWNVVNQPATRNRSASEPKRGRNMVRRPGQEQFMDLRADPANLGALTSSLSVGVEGEDVLARIHSEKNQGRN